MSYFDSIFTQGHSHTVCEDYSLHSGNESDSLRLAVVSDGCSSSEFTDVGSRILCLQSINRKEELELISSEEFGNHIAQTSSIILDLIGFKSKLPLFATLGFVAEFRSSGMIEGTLFGDGAFIFKTDGKTHLIKVDYDGNMPYYVAYNLNHEYEKSYEAKTEEFSNKNHSRIITHYILNNETQKLEAVMSYRTDFRKILSVLVSHVDDINKSNILLEDDGSFLIQTPKESPSLDFFFVASDGIFSFVEGKETESKLSENNILSLVISEISKIQPTAGGFIQRRIRKMKASLKSQQGLDHYDDLSVAGLMTGQKL